MARPDLPPEDFRVALYGSLLRGMAEQAQDRLCAQGAHAWGGIRRYPLTPDLPRPNLKARPGPIDLTLQIVSVRCCQNCGKEERR